MDRKTVQTELFDGAKRLQKNIDLEIITGTRIDEMESEKNRLLQKRDELDKKTAVLIKRIALEKKE